MFTKMTPKTKQKTNFCLIALFCFLATTKCAQSFVFDLSTLSSSDNNLINPTTTPIAANISQQQHIATSPAPTSSATSPTQTPQVSTAAPFLPLSPSPPSPPPSPPSLSSSEQTFTSQQSQRHHHHQQQQTQKVRDEIEADAIAAVEASMTFGSSANTNSISDQLLPSSADPCYDEYGNARFCEPEFENIALEKQIDVSSECGTPKSKFCLPFVNEPQNQIRECHICDASHSELKHPSSYLTDIHQPNKPTCWVSAPLGGGLSSSLQQITQAGHTENSINSIPAITANDEIGAIINEGSSSLQSYQQQLSKSDDVILTLNLDKKYEVTYVSLQFCSSMPESMSIYKSVDYGRSWTPYQFYSSNCRKLQSATNRVTTTEFEAVCSNINQTTSHRSHFDRIAFSTLDGRGSANYLDKSQALQDWITATNIKIVLDGQASTNNELPHFQHRLHQRHHQHHNQNHQHQLLHQQQQAPINKPKQASLKQQQSNNELQAAQQTKAAFIAQANTNNISSQEIVEDSLTNPSDTFNYAISDLTVGGRCKCNGHASRCLADIKEGGGGKLICDCRHNTAGSECERCAPFHLDRPWLRATANDANACQPCNCNGHSRKCKFDLDLYRLSGKKSGGVCIKCKHNTTGRHCHYCKEGFSRDLSKPMSDKDACVKCNCNSIGSIANVCNQTSGQCQCKEGVGGLQCNICLEGYQPSNSEVEPCVKIPDLDFGQDDSNFGSFESSSNGNGDNLQDIDNNDAVSQLATNLIHSTNSQRQQQQQSSIMSNTKTGSRSKENRYKQNFFLNNNINVDDDQQMKIKLIHKIVDLLNIRGPFNNNNNNK